MDDKEFDRLNCFLSEQEKLRIYKGVLIYLPEQLSLDTQAALAKTFVQMVQDECAVVAAQRQKDFSAVIKASSGII